MASKRVAEWRFPNQKQARAEETLRRMQASVSMADVPPEAPMPDNYWDALLADPRAKGRPPIPIEQRRLSEIPRETLRVECDKCLRLIEIKTSDAIRLYGPHIVWKDAAMKLMESGCKARTGNRDDDGCCPYFRR